jgi:hypothetical protein
MTATLVRPPSTSITRAQVDDRALARIGPSTCRASAARSLDACADPSKLALTESVRPPGTADLLDDHRATVGAAAADDDMCALGSERERDGPADVAGRASHERRLAPKSRTR